MARYIDIDQLIDKIESTDWYHISKLGELVRGANSKDDIPLYKYSDIKEVLNNAPTEDVVPRSEVERLEWELSREREYIEFLKVNIVLGKQEVAREIFEEIEKHILNETTKSRTIIKDGVNRCFSDYLEGQLVMLRKIPVWIAELKKKYIGE